MMKKYSALTKYINLLENDNVSEWIVDKENDGSSWMRLSTIYYICDAPASLPYIMYLG